MNLSELLRPDHVDHCTHISSKKRALEHISELLAKDAGRLGWNEIFDSLINREKLGSTSLGKGVALPHGRMEALEYPVCAFLKLDEPVDFDSSDGKPVDLLFALLVPEESTEEHLQILSVIAELFSNPVFCSSIRECDSDACLYRLLTQQEPQQISA
ncbi:MAG: PTS IIA-like nitrogen regulatory protein PtsN [Gammaproteobacteria bacterium]|nr:MAG: PTS IIA-like nitrogen regulatory protein PtsN [Gammaproteobacteria bacterium]